MFCSKEGGHFQTGEQGWVPHFPVSEGDVGSVSLLVNSGSVSLLVTSGLLISGGDRIYSSAMIDYNN